MHKRRHVNQLDNHGQIDMSSIEIAGRAAGQKREQRTEAFPASAYRIGDITFDRWIEIRRLPRDARLDFIELWLHQLRHSSQRAERKSGGRGGACKNFHNRRMKGD